MEEKSEKEKRVRAITHLYYSNPLVQEAILKFAKDREIVPQYFEGFGKRPDILQYVSDVNGLVKKGATSFHASEEIWHDPLELSSEMSIKEMNRLRKGWDLLIDIDSKYLDVSKILCLLILGALEEYGIKDYKIKFSGSKGFHIIVGWRAFPSSFNGFETSEMFPEWPRTICEYLTHLTRKEFNKKVGEIFEDVEEKKLLSKKEMKKEALCPECGRPARKGILVSLRCGVCGTTIQRKDMKVTKKRLKCVQEDCAGVFEVAGKKDYFECDYCRVSSINKMETSGRGKSVFTEYAKGEGYSDELKEEHSGIAHGASDLVLVAPRHLFRMPYSLHEKSALASVVLSKAEIESFMPRDANPMRVEIKDFYPENLEGEAGRLLGDALRWKKSRASEEEEIEGKKYSGRKFEEVEMKGVTDEMFPAPIKKLLNGLEDGRKRGLFVLLTFFRSCGFDAEEIVKRIREWNEKNGVPLKEGYVRSQIDWHLKQRRKILPPNYSNDAYYKDLGILEGKPKVKNPLVEVSRKLYGKRD